MAVFVFSTAQSRYLVLVLCLSDACETGASHLFDRDARAQRREMLDGMMFRGDGLKAPLGFEVALLSPSQAASLLERRRPGASTRPAVVRAYAEAMRGGKWVFNGIPVIIGDDDTLLDGVQRLRACVEADQPFPTLTVRGVAPAVLHTVDQQRRRPYCAARRRSTWPSRSGGKTPSWGTCS